MKLTLVYIVVLLSLFSGCVTPWTKSTGSLLAQKSRYRIDLNTPKDWYKKKVNKTMFFTIHGLSLEHIVLYNLKWTDTLSSGFRMPKKVLLNEIPEIIIGELCANAYGLNAEITKNSIEEINNFPCAVTRFSYTAPNSLRMQGIMCCIPFKSHITILRYIAEKSHYYEKSYEDFLTMLSTIQIEHKKYRYLPGIKEVVL